LLFGLIGGNPARTHRASHRGTICSQFGGWNAGWTQKLSPVDWPLSSSTGASR
jgi:hypothetical protein